MKTFTLSLAALLVVIGAVVVVSCGLFTGETVPEVSWPADRCTFDNPDQCRINSDEGGPMCDNCPRIWETEVAADRRWHIEQGYRQSPDGVWYYPPTFCPLCSEFAGREVACILQGETHK